LNSGIDAFDHDPGLDRRLFGMFAIDFDRAGKLGKFAVRGREILMDLEADRRMSRIEFIGLVRLRVLNERRCAN
jgi:hypothetical protein